MRGSESLDYKRPCLGVPPPATSSLTPVLESLSCEMDDVGPENDECELLGRPTELNGILSWGELLGPFLLLNKERGH